MSLLHTSQNAIIGIEEARQGNTTRGCALLEQALKETGDPVVQAWYAYCTTREGGNFSRALRLCHQALQKRPHEPDIYLALGRLYLAGQRRALAINALEKGLKLGPNVEISRLLHSIGVRKRPVVPFLPRNNPLNVTSGRLLARLGLR